jgi:tRNA threonylcarbamoyladenosine biosynthesis protein TsaB
MIFFGDGAEKTKSLFTSTENIEYIDNLYPSAIAMREEAVQKYRSEDFEDVAYFEPYYLKEFFLPTKK